MLAVVLCCKEMIVTGAPVVLGETLKDTVGDDSPLAERRRERLCLGDESM